MLFVKLMFLLVGVLSVLFVGSQIIWPLVMNRPLFPMFDPKRKAAEDSITRMKGEIDVAELLKKERELRKKK